MKSGAVFSDDRVYRYALWREWDETLPTFAVIGLNPSTADEVKDDATIRRCINFAKREGCGKYVMLNLFAYRTKDPAIMKAAPDPISKEVNDAVIRTYANDAAVKVMVAAWGVHGTFMGRGEQVRRMLPDLMCFGVTKDGYPRHPLYLPKDTPLVHLSPWCDRVIRKMHQQFEAP